MVGVIIEIARAIQAAVAFQLIVLEVECIMFILLSIVLGHGSVLYLDYRRYGRNLQAEEKEVV